MKAFWIWTLCEMPHIVLFFWKNWSRISFKQEVVIKQFDISITFNVVVILQKWWGILQCGLLQYLNKRIFVFLNTQTKVKQHKHFYVLRKMPYYLIQNNEEPVATIDGCGHFFVLLCVLKWFENIVITRCTCWRIFIR